MRQQPIGSVSDASGTHVADAAPAAPAGSRWWAYTAIVAHIAFVVSWLVAASWQGPRYSVLKHAISDLYAVGAPHGMFVIVVTTCAGAAALIFTWRSLRPSLRPGGWPATTALVLLSLSIIGIGDLLSPWEREACRQADPGCSVQDQVANAGGRLDGNLSTVGVVLLIASAFFLAAAMKRIPEWRSWARPTRWTAFVLVVLMVAIPLSGPAGLDGLFERLLAGVGAAGVVALGIGVLRRS
ncbi:DUF998 domain-containing protein [Streptomyces sp. NPDC051320]|uniref:DUF998 domain-containing protein n=1 Tax=Streptomyces sp. NPDC051320 TaxID=3154644 RepID=UPI00342EED42